MPNPFDQFDAAPGAAPVIAAGAANPFDQFDLVPPSTPFERAVARRDVDVADFQRQASKKQDFARQLEAQFGDQLPRDPSRMPGEIASDPYLAQRAPQIPAPEKSRDSRFKTAVKLGLVSDEETKRRILADSLFPGDPEGIYRVGIYKGHPVYVDDAGELRRVTSGPESFGANLIANAPEIVGGTVGSFAGVPGATLGASGMHGIKRGIAGLVFDEPQTTTENLKEMAVEGAATLVGEGVGQTFVHLGNRGRLIDVHPRDLRAAERVREHVRNTTGIDLNLAQASGDRRLIGLYAYVGRYPGRSADLVQAAEEAAAGQFDVATDRVLNLIATASPSEVAGAAGMNAAQLAIQATQRAVSARARPFYEAAFNAKPTVTEPHILRYLDTPYFMDAYARGQIFAAIRGEARQLGQPPDLRAMDYMKQGLDAVIEELAQGQPSLASALRQQKNAFVRDLDRITPEYARARRVYGALMRSRVEPLENGAVGVLARMNDPDAAHAAARIFADPMMSPQQVAATRAVIERQDPNAWNGLVRQWIAFKYDRSLREAQTGVTMNAAGKLRQAIYGTPEDRARLQAMLPEGAAQDFENLMTAAQHLGRTPIAGSNTMRDFEMREQMQGAAGPLSGSAMTIFRWLTAPRQTIMRAGERRAAELGATAVAQALIDPAARGQLRAVLRMPPGLRQGVLISTILAAQAGKVGFFTQNPQDEDIGGFAKEPEETEQ